MVCINVILEMVKKQYTAKFTITDAETKAAIAGVVVAFSSLAGTTAADGTVTIGPFRKGVYNFTAEHDDYEDAAGSFTAPVA
jgi:hypothetical protein